MNPDDELKFGSAIKASNYVPTEDEVLSRYQSRSALELDLPSLAPNPNNYVPSVDLMTQGRPVKPLPMSLQLADDPEELRRQQRMQLVQAEIDQMSVDLINERPAYARYILEQDNEHKNMNFFGKAWNNTKDAYWTMDFAWRQAYRKEQLIEDELTFMEEARRKWTNTLRFGEFVASFIQDIPKALTGGIVGGIYQGIDNSARMAYGLDPEDVRWQSDSFWWKLVYGREVERDLFGRVIEGTSRGREVRSITAMQKDYTQAYKDFQNIPEEERTRGQDIQAILFGTTGAPIMMALEAVDITLIGKGAGKLVRGAAVTRETTAKVVETVTEIIAKSGAEVTEQVTKDAAKLAKQLRNAPNALAAQRQLNEFLLRNVAEESEIASNIRGLDAAINLEIAQSRTTLDEIASTAPDFDTFAARVETALQSERAAQIARLSDEIGRISNEPAFRAGTQRLETIFRQFGESLADEDIFAGNLRDDTPAEIVDEFNRLRDQIGEVTEQQLSPLTNNLAAVSSAPLGRGVFDLTRNLLADTDQNLDGLLREVFDAQNGRRTTAIDRVNTNPLEGATRNDILDSIEAIQTQLSTFRNRSGRLTALDRLSDYLDAENIARGAIARGAFARRADEIASTAKEVTPETRVKTPSTPKPTPSRPQPAANQQIWDNAGLSIGDTLLKAADDAAKYDSFEEFVEKSDEVVYQGQSDLLFVKDKNLSPLNTTEDAMNPPMVTDMRVPLNLTGEAVPNNIARALTGRRLSDFSQGISEATARQLLEEAGQNGFDGIIFNMTLDNTGRTVQARMVLNGDQVIPASVFYDNIRGGTEVFGDGVSLAARRQQQADDILKKALPPMKEFDSLTKELVAAGLPAKLAEPVGRELHAQMLDRFLGVSDDLQGQGVRDAQTVLDADNEIRVRIQGDGVFMFGRVDGTPFPETQIMNRPEYTRLYQQVGKAFEADALKRVEDMKKVQVPGGITEEKFVALGPGHKKFNDTLNKRVLEGVFLPEEALLLRQAMRNVDDKLLKDIPMLESSGRFSDQKRGQFSANLNTRTGEITNPKITLARGLAYKFLRSGQRSRPGNVLTDTEYALATETFMHEFGHLGHRLLLDDNQRKIVEDVFKSMSRAEKRALFARSPLRSANISYYTSSVDEFFAQAFSEYSMRNNIVDDSLVPLFQRITQQMKAALKNLFTKKSNETNGKIDPLIPLFNQILKGQSSSRQKIMRSGKRQADEAEQDVEIFSRSSLNPSEENFANRRPLIGPRALEQNRKFLAAVPKGKEIPKSVRDEAIILSESAPPPGALGANAPQNDPSANMLDAKVPQDMVKLDPANPKTAEGLEPANIFPKGAKVGTALRKGQAKLAATMRKVQRGFEAKDNAYKKKIENLKASRQRAIESAKAKADTLEKRRKAVRLAAKQEEISLKVFGTKFSAAQNKMIINMVGNVKTKKQMEEAIGRIQEFADEAYRIEARDRIGKMIPKVEKGTRNIPPFWQEKLEERIGEEGIRLKNFRTDYEKRLKELQDFIEKNPERVEEFASPKTLKMVTDLEELQKRSIDEFSTYELVKMVYDIEKIYEQGEAAQFVIKGGTTKKITRPMVKVNSDGEEVIEDFVVQEGGIKVMGLEEIWARNQADFVQEAAKKGDVANLDSGAVLREYGDIESAGFGGILDGLKNLAKGDWNAWNRGYLTYLTADRTVELMDKMIPNGPVNNLLLKPLRKAVNKGEDKGQQALNRMMDKEAELTKKYKLLRGKEGAREGSSIVARALNTGFTDANYERIAIHAYLKQGLRGKLRNVMTDAEIDKAKNLLPHEQEMYDFMREELDKLYPELEKVMRDVHGTRLSKVEQYFPIQTNILDNRTMEEVLSIEYLPNKRQIAKNFTIQRNPVTKSEMKMNARDIYAKHMRDVNYFVNVEPEIRRVAAVTKQDTFRNSVGDNAGLWWQDYIDTVARRGIPKNYEYGWGDEIRKNLGAATLGFNPSPVLKQPLAAMAALPYVGPINAVLNGHSFMYRHGLFDAIGNISVEQRLRAADDPAFTDLSLRGKLSDLQERGYKRIKQVDAHTARGIWMSAYIKQAKKMHQASGKSGPYRLNVEDFKKGIGINQDAVDYADTIVRKSQGSGKFQDLPQLLTNKDKRLWTWLFQFQSFLLSQSQIITHDAFYGLIQSARGKNAIKLKDAAGFTAITVPSIGTAMAFEQEITRWLTSLYGSEASKEFQENQTTRDRFVQGLYGAVPLAGTAMGLFDTNINTNVPVVDKLLRGGVALGRAISADRDTLQGRETTAMQGAQAGDALISLALGVPGTSFYGQLLRNLAIQPSFNSPSENLMYAIQAGDKAEVEFLLRKYAQEGLDIGEIEDKTIRLLESDARAQRKKDVDAITEMVLEAKTQADRQEIADMLREGLRDGTITEDHIKEIESNLRQQGRLEALGEV